MSTSLWQWGIPPEKCAGDPALHKADAFEAIQRDENRRKAIFQVGGRVRGWEAAAAAPPPHCPHCATTPADLGDVASVLS